MIKRILELEVQGFRSMLRRQTIPLDADAVILYGPNGTGKSGLFSAIEYALTGTVADFARFGDDYPRCLTHVRSNEPGQVSLGVTTEDGARVRVVAVAGIGQQPTPFLSEKEKTSY